MKKIVIPAMLAATLFTGAAACEPGDAPAGVEVNTDTPDCDLGDLYEKKPDPDCGGLWLGTPSPATKKTPGAPAPAPTRAKKPTTTRTRR